MLTKLLNRLGKWNETMAVAAFAEAGDFSMIEKALSKDRKGAANLRKRNKMRRHISPARG
ncbi:MAG: hypothetical protein WC855_02700 [Thermodesulfovibrionales bacterium]